MRILSQALPKAEIPTGLSADWCHAKRAVVKIIAITGADTFSPAGDPIEFGAAAEVFGSLSGGCSPAAPLVLLSSKSWYGHSEPGAGVVGLIHSATAMRQSAVLPISHLRTLNPMVSNILEAAGYQAHPSAGGSSSNRGWVLPRGTAGWSGPQVVGTSAFAYQVGR